MASVFNFVKNSSGALDISMYGVLRGSWTEGTDEAALANAIKSCLPTDSITLHINSEGGDMFAGIAIRNMLAAHPGEVTCVVEGIAASAASIAAMAGKTVMRSGAMMMVHNPWAVVMGDADDMRAAANMLDKSQSALVAIYQEKTGKSVAALKALLSAETWMTADEAVKAGFADEEDDDEDEDDVMNVVTLNKRSVRINNVDFPRHRVPPQILAMARQIDNPTQEQPMKTVFAALSLKDNATEAEALGAVVRINDSHRKLLAAIGKESADEAVGFVTALKAKSENYDALATELETVKAEKLAVEATALLDEAVKDGRVSHAKRPEFEALHKECGLKALKVCLAALPKSAEPARPPSSAPAAPSAALDPDQIKLAKLTGVSVEDREKHRQVLRASRGISKEQE